MYFIRFTYVSEINKCILEWFLFSVLLQKHTQMKILFFLLGTSSLAFGQSLASEKKPLVSKHFSSADMSSFVNNDEKTEPQLTVTYEDKKLKQASIFSADGKLLQTSSKILFDEKKLQAGEYLVKIDFQDGTSTSTKFTKK